MKHRHLVLSCIPIAVAMSWVGVAGAQAATTGTNEATTAPAGVWIAPSSSWQAVSDAQLGAMRGGFDVGNGLLASFGIDRVVYINGNLVASTRVNIPDVGAMTPQQAAALASTAGSVNVTQLGPGNTFSPSTLGQAAAATVIQNSLDNQDIKTLTTINASVNGLDQFRSSHLAETLQAALVNSLGH